MPKTAMQKRFYVNVMQNAFLHLKMLDDEQWNEKKFYSLNYFNMSGMFLELDLNAVIKHIQLTH